VIVRDSLFAIRYSHRLALGVIGAAVLSAAGATVWSRTASSAAASPAGEGFSELADRDTQIRVWHQALDADPRSAIALGHLAALHLQRAREGGGWSDYLEAESFARRSLAIRVHRNGSTAVTLASSLLAQHRFGDAFDVAQALVSREPEFPQYRALLGEVAMELGRYDVAGAMLDSLWSERMHLSIAPRLARWHELNGRMATARAVLDRAREEAMARRDVPRETKAWFAWRVGEHAMRGGRLRGAEAAFRDGLAIEPNDPRLLAGMAQLFAASGAPKRAIEYGERAIAQQLDPATLGLLSDAYGALGDSAKARELQRAMETSISGEPASFHRAWSLYLLDHRRRVDDVLRMATNDLRHRRDIYGYDLHAWALHAAGRHDDAAVSMQAALALATPDATLWFHDGMIARARGDTSRARASLGHALTLNPHFHPTQPAEARAVLDSLRRGR
jgi:tetratricopeptide (TPR) repeat protein